MSPVMPKLLSCDHGHEPPQLRTEKWIDISSLLDTYSEGTEELENAKYKFSFEGRFDWTFVDLEKHQSLLK